MWMPPEVRKLAGQGELREVDTNPSKSPTIAEDLRFLQANRIIQRCPMSLPLALVTAGLAYGGRA